MPCWCAKGLSEWAAMGRLGVMDDPRGRRAVLSEQALALIAGKNAEHLPVFGHCTARDVNVVLVM